MTTDLFTFVELYDRALATLAHILAKGAEHAESTGATAPEMLEWRLIHDMQPLRFQVAVVCNFSGQWPARVAGLSLPPDVPTDLTLEALQAAIADARAYLATLEPAQFAGRDDVPLTVALGNGMSPTLPSARWLTHFATTNLYFHLSTAYGILRAHGTPIGKVDLFPTGL